MPSLQTPLIKWVLGMCGSVVLMLGWLTSGVSAVGTVGAGYQWQERTGATQPITDCSRSGHPSCRFYTTMVTVDTDTLLVFGGLSESYFVNTVYNDLWKFQFSTGLWTLISTNDCADITKPQCRCAASGMYYNGAFILTAGEDLTVNPAFPYGDYWTYNITTRRWKDFGSSMWLRYGPEPAEMGYITHQGKLYMFGGRVQYCGRPHSLFEPGEDNRFGILHDNTPPINAFYLLRLTYTKYVSRNHMYVFDPVTFNLTMISGLRVFGLDPGPVRYIDCQSYGVPCSRSPGMAANGNFIYVGSSQIFTTDHRPDDVYITNPTVNDVWQFNIVTKTWTQVSPVNCTRADRYGCRQGYSLLFRPPNSLLMFGGVVEQPDWHPVNDMWTRDLSTSAWTQITNTYPFDCDYTRPAPRCMFWFSALMMNRTLVTFGGNNFETGTKQTLNQLWSYRVVPTTHAYNNLPLSSPPQFTGPTTGGTTFTIQGDHFGTNSTALSVLIGGMPCTALVLSVYEQEIICRTPPGGGAASPAVVVVNEAGAWYSEPLPYFKYFLPNITSMSSTNASTDGSALLTVYGTNFGAQHNAAWVSVGGKPCISTQWVSHQQVICQVPQSVGRSHAVLITVVDQNSSTYGSRLFSYDGPSLTNVTFGSSGAPTSGNGLLYLGGHNIGNGLDDAVNVTVGDKPCPVVGWSGVNNVVCSIPAGTGTAKNILLISGGQSTVALGGFSYDPPVVYAISPRVFIVDSPVSITILGNNFGPDTTDLVVRVGERECAPLVMAVPHTTLICTIAQLTPIGELVVDVTASGQPSTASVYAEVNNPALSASFVNAAAALAIFCFIIIIATFVTLILNRNTFTIKSASIPFLVTILVGSALLAGAIFRLDRIDSSPRNKSECYMEYWLVACGFSILYGALLMKNWRMLIIFKEQKLQVRLIRDVYLFVALLVLLLIDNFLMLVYYFRAHSCGTPGTSEAYFAISIIVGIKVVMVLCGVYVAYQSRIIDIEEFNERHQLAYEFYNVFIVLVFIAPVTLILQTDASLSFLFRLLALVMMSAGSVLILFMPKFLEVLRSNGENPFKSQGSSRNLQRSRGGGGGARSLNGAYSSKTQGNATQNFSELTVADEEKNDSRGGSAGQGQQANSGAGKNRGKTGSKASGLGADYEMQVPDS